MSLCKEKFKLGDILMCKGECTNYVFAYVGTQKSWCESEGLEGVILGTDIIDMDKKEFDNICFNAEDVELAPKNIIASYKKILKSLNIEKAQIKASCIKPLDFIATKDRPNDIGLVTETCGVGGSCSVAWIKEYDYQKTAWWDQNELVKIGNLPNLIARNCADRLDNNQEVVDEFY